MEIKKMKLAGQDVLVDVEVENEFDSMDYALHHADVLLNKMLGETVRSLYDSNALPATEPDDSLFDELEATVVSEYKGGTWEDFCERLSKDVVNGAFRTFVLDTYKSLLDEQLHYYEVSVEYHGEFTVKVKAKDEYAARSYVESSDAYDLQEYVDIYDAEFDVDDVDEVSPRDYERDDYIEVQE